jgi:hypothetical protein
MTSVGFVVQFLVGFIFITISNLICFTEVNEAYISNLTE